MKKIIIVLLCLVNIVLFSCSSSKVEKEIELNPVYVTNSKKINLLSPECVDKNIQTYQLVEGSFGKNDFSLMAYIEINNEGIFISLLNDLGTDMGTVFFDGNHVIFESLYFPKNLKGEYVISDIQNVYYSVNSLKNNYENAGLNFECYIDENDVETRIIKNENEVIEQITIKGPSILIKNNLRGYEYNLTDGGIVE